MTNVTTTTNDAMYSNEEYAQLQAARARRAALKPTPLAPQSGITARKATSDRKAASDKRRNAPLYSNKDFSLLK